MAIARKAAASLERRPTEMDMYLSAKDGRINPSSRTAYNEADRRHYRPPLMTAAREEQLEAVLLLLADSRTSLEYNI